ncbi:MAG: hypothetical protein ABW154_10325, partial [Dyella sp.]
MKGKTRFNEGAIFSLSRSVRAARDGHGKPVNLKARGLWLALAMALGVGSVHAQNMDAAAQRGGTSPDKSALAQADALVRRMTLDEKLQLIHS